MGGEVNWTTLIVAILGTGGITAFAREIISGFGKIGRGVSSRESKRKDDLVRNAERAYLERDEANERYERERRNRWKAEDDAAISRRIIISRGLERELPPEPEYEDTVTTAEMRKMRDQPAQEAS